MMDLLSSVWNPIFWYLIRNYIGRYIMKPFKNRVLKKIKDNVFIDDSKSKHPTFEEVSGKNINGTLLCYDKVRFWLYIDSKATIPVSVESINCMFIYNGMMIQNMMMKDGDILATNGAEVNLVTIEAGKSSSQMCPFNPFPYVSALPESNEGWGIKGTIKFHCFFGKFEKEFNLEMSIATPEKWNKSRLKYQQLCNLVFGMKV